MKKWEPINKSKVEGSKFEDEEVLELLLKNRGINTKAEITQFLQPPDPYTFTTKDVGINKKQLSRALDRLEKAVKNHESVVVYADYDADGITAGTIMWESLHLLGANVMPYVPHRVDEGYGFSQKGIDNCLEQYDPSLIISVDHGVTAKEKIAYAQSRGVDVIVTDHHVLPSAPPDCTLVHTTSLCGAGVSWFVTKELLTRQKKLTEEMKNELLALAAIGTIGDLVPLVNANRSIVKYGLEKLRKTKRVGLQSLISNAGISQQEIGVYEISHMIVPRLNAMGRLVHGLDALRLLCTQQRDKADMLAQKLGLTNQERQQMTIDLSTHAKELVRKRLALKKKEKLLFVAHEDYNQGVIGLVAGKLVEEFYLPAIVVAQGKEVSKASARSVPGYDIIVAIRKQMDLLVDAGGHPMAAGFTVLTINLPKLQKRLEEQANKDLSEELLLRVLHIDLELSLQNITPKLWKSIQSLAPFGMSNPEPVFMTKQVKVLDARLVGAVGKHLKLKLTSDDLPYVSLDAIGFGLGDLYPKLQKGELIDIAYTIDINVWNGDKRLQLKLRDVHIGSD